jgi:restriction endonuclease S subunit
MSEWKKVKIGEFLTESKIIAVESDAAHRITVRLNCKGVEQRSLKAEKEGATKYYIRKAGQFIYGKQNIHKGAFGIIPQELDGFTSSADLPAFDVDLLKCIPEWICICLQKDNYYKSLQKNVKGVGSQRLAVNVFLDSEIPLPSVKTQKEIIKKIKLQLQKTDQLSIEIESQKSYIKQLRQNILQEAIEGKLTADWRKQNPVQKGNPDYDAEALFEQIQKERNSDKKQKELSPITNEEKPFELPVGWKWVRLGNIVENITSGSREWAKYYSDKGAIFLRMGNLSRNSYNLRLDNLQYVCVPETTEGKRTRLVPFDLLFSITAEIGNLGLIPENFPEAYINQHTARIRFVDSIRQSLFFANSLLAPAIRKQYMPNTHGMKNSFRLDTLSYLLVPLPPLAEQREIVAQIEKYLQTVSDLENQIIAREQLTKQLTHTILKEDF